MSQTPAKPTIRRTVRTPDLMVEVEVPAVIPDEDPGEPCLDAAGVAFVREVEARAARGDLAWLLGVGRVYRRTGAGDGWLLLPVADVAGALARLGIVSNAASGPLSRGA